MGFRLIRAFCFMELDQLAAALVALGCPVDKSREMAAQLDKRARQLSEQQGRTYEESLTHLFELMKQGWAAAGGS
jgi:hypothetical protein